MRGALLVLASVSTVSLACATTSPASDPDAGGDGGIGVWSYDGPQSACSTGPIPENEVISPLPRLPEGTVNAPECVARCGFVKELLGHYGLVWTTDALPRGVCEHDGEVCSMGAVRSEVCADGSKIVCRCEERTWRCYHGAKGRSACSCPDPDAAAP
jgi:hypothetical protein